MEAHVATPIDSAIAEAMAELDATAEEPEAPAEEEPVAEEPEPEGDEIPEDPEVDETEELEEEPDPEEGDVDEVDDEDNPEDETDDDPQTFQVKVDGEEIEVPLEELLKGYQRQADYTRKTQELAEERKELEGTVEQVRAWYEERSANPAGWISEIAEGTGNPAGTLADAIGATQDPTGLLAWTIRTLAEKGRLSQKFVETFHLEEIYGTASEAEERARLERVEKRLEDREKTDAEKAEEAERARQQQQILAEYERQWSTIKSSEGLEFGDPQQELDARIEVMKFARDQGIGNLETAYAAMAHKGIAPRTEPAAPPADEPDPKAVEEAVARKRQHRAMARKPVGGAPAKPSKPTELEAIIRESMSELGMAQG